MEKLKQAIWPALGGIVAGMALLTFGFGFMSAGAADKLVSAAEVKATATAEKVTASLVVPQCVEAARADAEKLDEVLALTYSAQTRAFEAANWTFLPEGGSDSLKKIVNKDCLDELKRG